jgi:phosphotransferase system enzyme I (PtsI)
VREPSHGGEQVFRGIPVSSGVCRGKLLVLDYCEGRVPSYSIAADQIPAELMRLQTALVQTRGQIIEVQKKVSKGLGAGDAAIFDAHLLVLEDQTLIDEVARVVQDRQVNVDSAFQEVAARYAAALSAIEDEYLRERAADMRDVTSRVLTNLMGGTSLQSEIARLTEPCIIISEDLPPSVTALLDKKLVLGFATHSGSKTSHTSIMARAMQIPAMVGLKNALDRLKTGGYALLDGYHGQIILNPTDQTLFEYGQLVRKQVNLQEKLQDLRDKPAVTLDGTKILLSANIEQPSDVEAVKASGADGVGLFRTEYLFLNRDSFPTEDEQYEAYRQAAEALHPQPVVIRTLDLGGDKFLSHLHHTPELNPFLGWRAIRFCLEERDLFRAQLRAILRASAGKNVRMMYPMISNLQELEQANSLVAECQEQLRANNIPFDPEFEIGVMIEIPSAALAADALARRVKFFSIGTNDLIQYSLAVDRLNDRIAHLYQPTHPAILRLIKMTVDSARPGGVRVSVCGEMAGDPVMVPLLLGLGVDELSVAPSVLPQVKFLIRRLKMAEADELAVFALQCESGEEILAKCQTLAETIAPSLFEK